MRSVLLIFLVSLAIPTATAQESPAIWGLFRGDSFLVGVSANHRTETKDPAGTVSSLETRDEYQLEYSVVDVSPNGDAVLNVSIVSPDRETRSSESEPWKKVPGSLRRLDGVSLAFQLAPNGAVTAWQSSDRAVLYSLLAGHDERPTRLLSDSCPPDVLAGWFAVPFWLSQSAAENAAGKSEPTLYESMGPFGILKTHVTMEKETAEDNQFESLALSGTPGFVPLVRSRRAAENSVAAVPLSDLKVSDSTFSGHVRIRKPENGKTPIRRPPFDLLEYSTTMNGTVAIPSLDGESGEKTTLSFTSVRRTSLIVAGFSYEDGSGLMPALPVEEAR